jgi:hypothetical protein
LEGKIIVMKAIRMVVFLSVLAAGCNKSNSGNTTSPEIFPNKIGDSWHYLVKDTTVQGSQDSGSVQYTVDVLIVDTIQWSPGVTAAVWQYHFPHGIDTNYVFQSGDTIKFMDNTKSNLIRQYIIPFSAGSSWPYTWGFNTVTVLGQGQINTGNNVFMNAWQIYGSAGLPDASFLVDERFADHVGFVKKYFNPLGELIYTKHILDWSLISYELR